MRSTPFEVYFTLVCHLPIRPQEPVALGLVESRVFPKDITLQVYRPAGRPRYATDTA